MAGVAKRSIPGFAINSHKGTQITFANGITVSVQWGPGNYCEVGDFMADGWDAPSRSDYWESPDAEIALFVAGARDWVTKEAHAALNNGEECSDDVIGRITPDEVARYISWAVSQPNRKGETK
jgi:hypothetical protein